MTFHNRDVARQVLDCIECEYAGCSGDESQQNTLAFHALLCELLAGTGKHSRLATRSAATCIPNHATAERDLRATHSSTRDSEHTLRLRCGDPKQQNRREEGSAVRGFPAVQKRIASGLQVDSAQTRHSLNGVYHLAVIVETASRPQTGR